MSRRNRSGKPYDILRRDRYSSVVITQGRRCTRVALSLCRRIPEVHPDAPFAPRIARTDGISHAEVVIPTHKGVFTTIHSLMAKAMSPTPAP